MLASSDSLFIQFEIFPASWYNEWFFKLNLRHFECYYRRLWIFFKPILADFLWHHSNKRRHGVASWPLVKVWAQVPHWLIPEEGNSLSLMSTHEVLGSQLTSTSTSLFRRREGSRSASLLLPRWPHWYSRLWVALLSLGNGRSPTPWTPPQSGVGVPCSCLAFWWERKHRLHVVSTNPMGYEGWMVGFVSTLETSKSTIPKVPRSLLLFLEIASLQTAFPSLEIARTLNSLITAFFPPTPAMPLGSGGRERLYILSEERRKTFLFCILPFFLKIWTSLTTWDDLMLLPLEKILLSLIITLASIVFWPYAERLHAVSLELSLIYFTNPLT